MMENYDPTFWGVLTVLSALLTLTSGALLYLTVALDRNLLIQVFTIGILVTGIILFVWGVVGLYRSLRARNETSRHTTS